MMTITFDLVGVRPLLHHNGRLANPLDPLTRQVAILAAKRKKTTEEYQLLLGLEAYAGCWQTADGRMGLPTENVWRCLQEAATSERRGKDIKRALRFEADEIAPLRVNGKDLMAREYVSSSDPDHVFIRTVNINGRKTLRARAIVKEWTSTHTFELLDDVLDPDALESIIERAGRLVGVGDWRPLYGLFTAENMVVKREELAA